MCSRAVGVMPCITSGALIIGGSGRPARRRSQVVSCAAKADCGIGGELSSSARCSLDRPGMLTGPHKPARASRYSGGVL